MHDFALVLLRRGHLKIMVQILGFVGYCLSREHACCLLSQQVPQGEMISVVSLSSLTGGCRRLLSSSPPLPRLLRLLPPPHLPFLFPFFSWYKRSNPGPLRQKVLSPELCLSWPPFHLLQKVSTKVCCPSCCCYFVWGFLLQSHVTCLYILASCHMCFASVFSHSTYQVFFLLIIPSAVQSSSLRCSPTCLFLLLE